MSNIQLPDWAQPLIHKECPKCKTMMFTVVHICPSCGRDTLKDGYRYMALHGGRGSSKSWSVAMALVVLAASTPNILIFCGREVQKSIKDSVKKLIDDSINRLGMRELFKSTDVTIRAKNKSQFIFGGLQHNVDSIKSLEGAHIFWGEEAQTFSQVSLTTLRPTMRTPGSYLIFTWNPKNANDPVDTMFRVDETPPRAWVKEVNWRDNPWFPAELNEERLHDQKRDPGLYDHIWEGGYLTRSNANVFQHWTVQEFEAPDDAFFRFGCDWGFSVDPTVLIRCYNEPGSRKLYIDYEAYQVGCEIDDTPALFASVPESHKWPIIADSASPERISYMRKHGYPKMMKALKGAKSIEEGIAFLQSHEIIVHPRCKYTIEEMMNYKYKTDPLTDEITNVLEDKNNHICVAEGTLIMTSCGELPIEHVWAGDKVLTRGGYQRVLKAHDNGIQDVIELHTDLVGAKSLVCTPDHKILTSNGWLRADAIGYNDDVLYIGENSWGKQKELNLKVINTGAIQTLSASLIAVISKERSRVGLPTYTEMYGCTTMAPCLKDTTFITRMVTSGITLLKILSASVFLTMLKSTGLLNAMLSKLSTSKRSTIWQKNGTLLTRVENFMLKMLERCMRPFGPMPSSEGAINVEMSSQSKQGTQKGSDSALTGANQPGDEIKDWMMLTAHADTAERRLESINTERLSVATGRVLTSSCGRSAKRVYDLSVENYHEYVANGILVQNCDSLRYSQEAVRRMAKVKAKPKITPTPSKNYWS